MKMIHISIFKYLQQKCVASTLVYDFVTSHQKFLQTAINQIIYVWEWKRLYYNIFNMTIWLNLSCWNPFNTFTTIFTRKRKYAIDDSVDNEISTKRRNKRRQQLWITLKRQFASICFSSCSISIFILFIWSGK